MASNCFLTSACSLLPSASSSSAAGGETLSRVAHAPIHSLLLHLGCSPRHRQPNDRQLLSYLSLFSTSSLCSSTRLHCTDAFPSKNLNCVCVGVNSKKKFADVKEQPPASREEAVDQARSAISNLLERSIKRQVSSFKPKQRGQRQTRLRVEIPLLDNSPRALFSLTKDLVATNNGGKEKYAVYCSDSALTELATTGDTDDSQRNSHLQYFDLHEKASVPADTSVIFVICPTFSQISDLSAIAKAAGNRPVVVVNPDWSADEEEDGIWRTFCQSFEVVFSYTPLSIQGFLSKTEGAILKHVRSGAPAGTLWLIFVKEGGTYVCVSSLKNRPDAADLEAALYNSIAANSPLVKSIKFLRQAFHSK
ncbi:hypothetical protein O6H91_03G122500 [Diphasiastrum complanatum]|nr:hypothetical protein O6H91_03G122500 [Diphasiastrum complanatum]